MPHGLLMLPVTQMPTARPEQQHVIDAFLAQGTRITEIPAAGCTMFLLDHPDFLPDTERGQYHLHLKRLYDGQNMCDMLSHLTLDRDGTSRLVKDYLAGRPPSVFDE